MSEENSDRYIPTDPAPLPVDEQLRQLIAKRAPGSPTYARALSAIEAKDAEIERLRAERDDFAEQLCLREPSQLSKDLQHVMGLRNADLERLASLSAENERLRVIISKCADALGNGAAVSPDCSIEFMGDLPSEIGLHVASLTEDRDTWKSRAQQFQRERAELSDTLNGTPCAEIRWQYDRDSLRAKLDRAREYIEKASIVAYGDLEERDAVLSELSADAPAQPPQFPKCRKEPVDVRDFIQQHASHPQQLSDDARSLLDEAIAALEPVAEAAEQLDDDFRDASDIWEHSSAMALTGGDLRRANAVLAKLRSARDEWL